MAMVAIYRMAAVAVQAGCVMTVSESDGDWKKVTVLWRAGGIGRAGCGRLLSSQAALTPVIFCDLTFTFSPCLVFFLLLFSEV
jgi:hypothetical protein